MTGKHVVFVDEDMKVSNLNRATWVNTKDHSISKIIRQLFRSEVRRGRNIVKRRRRKIPVALIAICNEIDLLRDFSRIVAKSRVASQCPPTPFWRRAENFIAERFIQDRVVEPDHGELFHRIDKACAMGRSVGQVLSTATVRPQQPLDGIPITTRLGFGESSQSGIELWAESLGELPRLVPLCLQSSCKHHGCEHDE